MFNNNKHQTFEIKQIHLKSPEVSVYINQQRNEIISREEYF